jgi:serine/threonine protein kinase/tetratricopeptide (TPR) repeat protein
MVEDTEEADSLVRAVAAAPARSPGTLAGPIPSRVGRFVIQKHLGAGGMGVVYLATDPDLERKVAVKLIRSRHDAALRASASARLLREAQAMAQLSHPNVAPIFEVGDHEGSVYIAMEYIDGETLTQWLRRAPRAWVDTLDCFLQAAAGLNAAHAAGLIHRDFKPDNALRGDDGRVRVVDFGLARLFQVQADDHDIDQPRSPPAALATDLTQLGAVVGTPLYMAPEQHAGRAATAKSDQFSFCVVLWEALYGSHPFPASSYEELAKAAATEPGEPANRHLAPESVLSALKRGLALDPSDRFPTMASLMATLEEAREASTATPARHSVRFSDNDLIVGYVAERRQLIDALADVEHGAARAIAIVGEAGMGKSSLLADFVARARNSENLTIATGACHEQHGSGEGYLPFFEATARAVTGGARTHVRRVLQSHAPLWSLRVPSLDLSTGERESLRSETEGATPERMRRELCDFVSELSRVSTVVLAFEDFQWSDASSLALLQQLIRDTKSCSVMIVVTTRSALSLDGLTTLELRGLSPNELQEFLDHRFAPNQFPSTFRDALYERSHGNPLVMRSLLELATRRGVVRREGTAWVVARAFDLENDTLQVMSSLIDGRVQTLPPVARSLLDCASVSGDRFTALLLARALDLPDAQVQRELAELQQRTRLVTLDAERPIDSDGTPCYRFAHARYRAVLYDSIAPARRKTLHADVAAALASLSQGVNANAARVAQHLDAAGEHERASHVYVNAADAAAQRLAFPEAETHIQRALELVRLTGNASRDALSLRLRCAQLRIQYCHFRDVIRETAEIAVNAQQLDEPSLESAARRALCTALFYSSQIPEFIAAAKVALERADRVGDDIERAKVLMPLGLVRMTEGALDSSRQIFTEAVTIGRRAVDRNVTSHALIGLGMLDYFQSSYVSAERQLEEAYESLQAAHDTFLTSNARFFLALALGNLGRIDRAFALLHKAAAVTGRNADVYWLPRIPSSIGWLLTELGAYAEARAQNALAVRLSRSAAGPESLTHGLINLAIACAHAQDHAASLAALTEAGNLCMRGPRQRWRYDMRHKLAVTECALARGDLQMVCDAARITLTRAHDYGAGKYVVHAHRLLAEALVRMGQVHEAREHLDAGLAAIAPITAPFVEWRIHAAAVRVYTAAGDAERVDVARAQLDQAIEALVVQTSDPDLPHSFRARVVATLEAS